MEITIVENPQGYSKGFFGYSIRTEGKEWTDGGYGNQKLAEIAAKKMSKEIKKLGLDK